MLLVATVTWLHYMFMIPLALLSIFLSLVILVQRGRGGGLTGALGGMGGQSAFGTKAGDLFTRITIIVAAIWVLLSMGALKILNQQSVTGGFNPGMRAPENPPAAPANDTMPPAKAAEAAKTGDATKSGEASNTAEAGTAAEPSGTPGGSKSTPAASEPAPPSSAAPNSTAPADGSKDASPADAAKP